MKKHRKTIVILLPILCFIVIWGISLAKCEILTLIHGNEFSTQAMYENNTMIGNMEYIKILDYTDNYARIYYVSEDKSLGNIIEFLKIDNKWIYSKWADSLWSTSGNADRVIWPYWWHVIYFWF